MNDSQLRADNGQPALVWRRGFLRATVGGTAGLAAWSALNVLVPAPRAAAEAATEPEAAAAARVRVG
jgi:hypothetical protein